MSYLSNSPFLLSVAYEELVIRHVNILLKPPVFIIDWNTLLLASHHVGESGLFLTQNWRSAEFTCLQPLKVGTSSGGIFSCKLPREKNHRLLLTDCIGLILVPRVYPAISVALS